MTPEEAKKIKSLRIENQLIEDEISRKTEVFAGVLIKCILLIVPSMVIEKEY